MNAQLLSSQHEPNTRESTAQGLSPSGGASFRFASYGRAIIGHGRKATLDVQRVKRLGLGAAARQLLAEQSSGSILAGVIPFDSSQAPFLFVPESFDELSMRDVARADSEPPAVTQVLGEYNPDFICAVGAAIDEIRTGTVSKVVLSRTLEVLADGNWNPEAIWRRLYDQNPAGHSFEIGLPDNGGSIVGNSPELIAGVRHGQLTSHPLAGSAPRMAEISEDQETAATLARSPKNLSEHDFVVNHIAQTLRSVATNLRVPARPDLLATGRMWHLGTMIRADLYKGLGSLDAALAIHPTPAICGSPTAEARNLIEELEPAPRGFYGGLVGWMNQDGEGEWALLLRSAILNGASAVLHAGAGIVADSDSFDEHEETAAKFGTMLSALGIDTRVRAA
ncbi:isochorismate synthase EntC [Glutamicibacter uratoxydans]|uniref:isochorismate synthase n=1 Tax=Glutamicibacter uratoxydans TaxID=43667 RepID=A0A4Y4DMN1_GLUUR|nr:isochorismate synthase [Glutamicibacter uratoxydans]GED04905.1 isochorismate synthase EntC [Glutamicibacter uratoxydans]